MERPLGAPGEDPCVSIELLGDADAGRAGIGGPDRDRDHGQTPIRWVVGRVSDRQGQFVAGQQRGPVQVWSAEGQVAGGLPKMGRDTAPTWASTRRTSTLATIAISVLSYAKYCR